MAALENTLATAADGVAKPAPAVEEVADDAFDAAASEADDAVEPLEAWVEQKEAEEKQLLLKCMLCKQHHTHAHSNTL